MIYLLANGRSGRYNDSWLLIVIYVSLEYNSCNRFRTKLFAYIEKRTTYITWQVRSRDVQGECRCWRIDWWIGRNNNLTFLSMGLLVFKWLGRMDLNLRNIGSNMFPNENKEVISVTMIVIIKIICCP